MVLGYYDSSGDLQEWKPKTVTDAFPVTIENNETIPVVFSNESIGVTGVEVDTVNVLSEVIAVAPVVGQKTVTSTAAALFAGVSQLATRQFMKVFNESLSGTVYVGPSGVTLGYPIGPGEEKSFQFKTDTAVAIYGVTDGAAVKVRVMEA